MKHDLSDYLLLMGFILAYISCSAIVWDALHPQTITEIVSYITATGAGGCVILGFVFLN